MLRLVQAIKLSLESVKVEFGCHKGNDDGNCTVEGTGFATCDHEEMGQDQRLVLKARLFAFSSTRNRIEESEFVLSKVQLKVWPTSWDCSG